MASSEVVAAIPTHNQAEQLEKLLAQHRNENYSAVFVLDDASDDDTSFVLRGFKGEVEVIRNNEKRGPAATRNLIMHRLGNAIIHFSDSDMSFNSDANAEKIGDLFTYLEPNAIGYVGGMVRNPSGLQAPFNYTPKFSFWSQWIQQPAMGVLYEIAKKDPSRARSWRDRMPQLFEGWATPEREPLPQPIGVYGCTEANLIISAAVLRRMNGFDERLRFFESAELALRMEKAGLPRYFYPKIDMTHGSEIGLGEGFTRLGTMIKNTVPIIGNTGLKNYLFER